MFKPVPSRVDFPELERQVQARWQAEGTMGKYLRRNENAKERWSFIDGPITANNPMGVHHAWGRTYKDLFQRYKTMRGFRQRYQNGFDCQGLWIEVEVEKERGFTSKQDIEAYGIDKFVENCKARVRRFAAQITDQSIRLGYWMDWDNSYFTNSDENNYAIWRLLKICHERSLLYSGHDVMPWCPRCGTGLSNMEIATEGYKDITHRSVYVKFPLNERPGESLLVWTTTPWTLTANVAAAVHPEHTYVRVRVGDDRLILAKAALRVLKGQDYAVDGELPGSELVGLTYRGPFDELPLQEGVLHRVVPWEEVSEEEGTGIVHIAPGCGQEDFALGKEFDLAVIAPIDQFGMYDERAGAFNRRFAGDVVQDVFDSLKAKGALHRIEPYSHRYPVCWRCGTELLFRLVDEWFISMNGPREQMMDVTRRINWIPDFGEDRELDWLRNMDDWMISKKRYYGLALPIYPCECGHVEVIGSREELRQKAVEGWEQFEGHTAHRPYIDAVKVSCPKCGSAVSRIEDVGNPWLDAGIVPFSTLHYDTDPAYWQEWFPADFITESFPGQFRNWFYALLAMSTIRENREPFRAVLGHGLVRDEKGEDMHKSKGNAIWFDEAADKIGADVMRWIFMRTNPAQNVNFGYGVGDEVRRQVFLTLWNTYSFFVTYATIDGYTPGAKDAPAAPTELDRWALSELNTLVKTVTDSLEEFDTMTASRAIQEFIDDLSNWYVRRSRRRFWKSEADGDKRAAYDTLYACLETVTRLMAPFTPFLADELYSNLVRSWNAGAPESVHLTDWPAVDAAAVDEGLSRETRLVMRLASLGRAARAKAGQKVRQPLGRALFGLRSASELEGARRLADQLAEELNVKEIAFLGTSESGTESDYLSYAIRPNLPALGPKYGNQVGAIRSALTKADPAAIAAAVRAREKIVLEGFALAPDEVLVEPQARATYVAAQDAGYTAIVTTEVTPELAAEGLAREIVHRVQGMRRDAGFNIADRIALAFDGDDEIAAVLARHDGYVRQETLAEQVTRGPAPDGAHAESHDIEGRPVALAVRRL